MMPNLLPSQRIKEKQKPIITLKTWVYFKVVLDFISMLAFSIGIFDAFRFLELHKTYICWVNFLSGFYYGLMTAILGTDTHYTYVMTFQIAKVIPSKQKVRKIWDIYQLGKKIIIWITVTSLCLSLVVPISFLVENNSQHVLMDSMIYLPLFIVGACWLGLDYIIVKKARKEYYAFEQTILDLVNNVNCTCEPSTQKEANTENATKQPLDNIGEVGEEIETKVEIKEEDVKEDTTTVYIRQFPFPCPGHQI